MSDLNVMSQPSPAKMMQRIAEFRSDFADFVRTAALSEIEAGDVLDAQREDGTCAWCGDAECEKPTCALATAHVRSVA